MLFALLLLSGSAAEDNALAVFENQTDGTTTRCETVTALKDELSAMTTGKTYRVTFLRDCALDEDAETTRTGNAATRFLDCSVADIDLTIDLGGHTLTKATEGNFLILRKKMNVTVTGGILDMSGVKATGVWLNGGAFTLNLRNMVLRGACLLQTNYNTAAKISIDGCVFRAVKSESHGVIALGGESYSISNSLFYGDVSSLTTFLLAGKKDGLSAVTVENTAFYSAPGGRLFTATSATEKTQPVVFRNCNFSGDLSALGSMRADFTFDGCRFSSDRFADGMKVPECETVIASEVTHTMTDTLPEATRALLADDADYQKTYQTAYRVTTDVSDALTYLGAAVRRAAKDGSTVDLRFGFRFAGNVSLTYLSSSFRISADGGKTSETLDSAVETATNLGAFAKITVTEEAEGTLLLNLELYGLPAEYYGTDLTLTPAVTVRTDGTTGTRTLTPVTSSVRHVVEAIRNDKNAKASITALAEDLRAQYELTRITIAGTPISEYRIRVMNSDITSTQAKTLLTDRLSDLGMTLATSGTKFIFLWNNAGLSGTADNFTVNVDAKENLYIKCNNPYGFYLAFEKFLDTALSGTGSLNFSAEYSYTDTVDYVTYAAFGAVGDGVTDDFDAIIAAHTYANTYGYTVLAGDDATYYIAKPNKPASIRTNVDWGKAKFIIDDREISLTDRSKNIFQVDRDYAVTSRTVPEGYTLARNATNLGMTFDKPCMVIIYCDTDLIYKRYGDSSQANGIAKSDVLLVDKNGNIDPSTPLVWSYENGVTRMQVYDIDETPVTLRGGNFTTIVNTQPFRRNGGYYERGIKILRSNTVLEGFTHTVIESDDSCPYYGIFQVVNANNVIVRNAKISGHKSYSGGANYEFQVSWSNNTLIENVTQINSITDTSLWGIMASSGSKNLVYDHCYLSRFDDHRGLCNGVIRNSEIGQIINLIGAGTFTVENSVIHGQQLLTIRTDYGASWEGDIIIRNCTFIPTKSKAYIVKAWWRDYDPGYLCFFPNIKIDGLKIDGNAKVYFVTKMIDTAIEDIRNHPNHPYVMPEKIEITGLTDKNGNPATILLAETDAVRALFKDTEYPEDIIK